ncbi:YncE family protein [Granulicella arctica]|uniref:Uncharacterized protein n=1 Tax=Granulicella arctica TaxID=940613 RepID=A0A7Y9TG30_9BACT|nr:hypothetical protein [Granulicella arctica]NYF79014.1 hypothetical protein [Granulicella arctica]
MKTRFLAISLACVNVFGQMAKQSPEAPPLPTEQLPGKGLAQHPFLYCGEWDTRGTEQTIYLVRHGKVDWTYSVPFDDELSDCTMLRNGNILFVRKKSGASEITPAKKIIWNYQAEPGTEVHVIQPLGGTRLMLVQNGNPAKLLILDTKTNRVEKTVILPVGAYKGPHGQFRRVRITGAGTILAAHMDNDRVTEYNMDGKTIWSVDIPSPWSAVRLKSGNTLIGSNYGFVREIDPKGSTVWKIDQYELPGYPLHIVQEVQRLANGNTLINNWSGDLKVPGATNWVQLIEVTPDKKVVWALHDYDHLGPASATQLLDESTNPEKPGDQQR